MGSARLLELFLYAMAGSAVLVWGFIIVRSWAPAAQRRGGQWYLEAMFLLAGPISMLNIALYPSDGSFSGPFPVINRALSFMVIGLALVALGQGLRNPRRKTGPIITAVTIFYLALIASGTFGVVPKIPEQYWITPLLVLAVAVNSGYTYEWMVRTARFALRLAVVLSIASIVILPGLAFNTEEARTIFGINRLQGIAGHPNGLAAIAALGIFLEIRSGSKWVWKAFYAAALLLAQSSTGYVVAVVGLLALSTSLSRAFRWVIATGAVVLVAVSVFVPVLANALIGSFLPDNASTFSGRTTIWAAAMHGFELNPLWGYGPELLGSEYRAMYLPGFDAAAQAHNQFVQTIASAGLIGLGSLLILFIVLAIYAVRGRSMSNGLSVALFVFLVLRGLTETPLRPAGVGFGTLMIVVVVGLIAVAASDSPRSNRIEQASPTQFVLAPVSGNPMPANPNFSHPTLARLSATATSTRSDQFLQSLDTPARSVAAGNSTVLCAPSESSDDSGTARL